MNPATKEVLLLTSTNLACNPRCLKELRMLSKQGHRVTLVAFELHNWTTDKEKMLREELAGVEFHYLDAGRHPLIPWLKATVMEQVSRRLSSLAPSDLWLAAMSINKRSWMLLQWVKHHRKKYHLIIAHNPPAFYAADWLANATGSPFAIDIEDYHPGEGGGPWQSRCATLLMRRLLPKATYVSFASPLIKEYSQRLVNPGRTDHWVVVNNTFSRTEFAAPAPVDAAEPVRLIWFSQYINYGRGLEQILPVLDEFRDRVRLTLVGSGREPFLSKETAGREYVRVLDAMPQAVVHRSLSNYDVGLAIEDGSADINKDICISNKIWSYLLSGLYIVSSDTKGQLRFMEEHPGNGVCSSLQADDLRKAIVHLLDHTAAIREGRAGRYDQGASAAWENESTLLAAQWKPILG